MPNDLRVSLTREEMAECQQAASLRWQLARAAGVVNQRRADGQDDADVDLLGIKGECAVAKAFGLKFSPFALGIDTGEDLFAGDLSLDVKSSFHHGAQLIFKRIGAFKADVSVLVTATEEPAIMRLVGWITKERYQREATAKDLGAGRTMALAQERLSSPEKLWRLITDKKAG